MALDFPSSPINGQVYSRWTYSSITQSWNLTPTTLPSNIAYTDFSNIFTSAQTINNTLTVNTLVKSGGTSSQYLMADGSVTTGGGSSSTLTIGTGLSGTSYDGSAPVTIANTGVLSVNGSAGTITGIATTAGNLSQFAATTSAQLAGVISDETGSGALVFATSPTLTTPSIGVATGTSFNSITGLSSTTPIVDGTAAVGTATTVARADHVHPTPTSVVATVTGTNSADLVYGNMADNDQFRIRVGGTATNAGFVELATADDGTEPIYVRQYSGVFTTLTRTATLLDGSGNTTFPGTVSASGLAGSLLTSTTGTALGTAAAGTSAIPARSDHVHPLPSTLTIGTGLSGTSYNGSGAVTIANTGVLSVNGSSGAITGIATTAGTLAQFAATTSAQLAGVVSDETGSGALVFGTSPEITTSLTTPSTSFNLINTTASTVNFAGAATALGIGAGTGTTTINNNLAVTGNLTINGTTTTVNSTVVTVDDPIFTLGGDTAPTVDDNKDRGVEFKWHNGTTSKVGFFGYDDSIARFTFIPDATNTSEVFSGTQGNIDVNDIYINGTISTGTGGVVRATSPSLTTPSIGVATGTSFNSITGLSSTTPAALGTAAVGTGTTTARADHVHPTTGLGLTSGTLGQFAATTSAQLAGVISDETGSGALVFATSPTLTTPNIGVATGSSLDLSGGIQSEAIDKDIITTRTKSGHWQTSTATTAEGWPTTTNGWYHLIASTHSNTANYYSLQLAAPFDSQSLYFRSTGGSGTQTWSQLAPIVSPTFTTPNIGVATGTSFNSITGLSSTAPATFSGTGVVGTAATVARADHAHPLPSTLTIGTGLSGGSYNGSAAVTIANSGVLSVNGGTGAVTGIATTAGNLSQFAATTSAQLAGILSDETGSGALVFGTSPSLTSASFTNSGVTIANTQATSIANTGQVNNLQIINAANVAGNDAFISFHNQGTYAVHFGLSRASNRLFWGGWSAGAAQYQIYSSADTLANSALTNSSVTINGSAVSLGGSATITAVNPNTLTIGTGLSGTSYNGSGAVTIANTGVLSVNGSSGAITGIATTAGTLAQFAATTSAQLAGILSDETGSGALVFATSPTLTTPSIGVATGTSFNSITGLSAVAGTALGTAAVGTATTVARADHVHPTTGLALTSGTLGQFASTTSAQLAAVISNETGSGALVFATSPSLTTPSLGAATATSLTTSGALALNYASPSITSNNASAASIFTSTVTGITIGSSAIKTTKYPAAPSGTTTGTVTQAAQLSGYLGMPVNQQGAAATALAYTLVASDAGKMIYVQSTPTTPTITIPANSAVAFEIGTTIVVMNDIGAATNVSIAITTDTMQLVGSGAVGTRTLARYGIASMTKVTATKWIISGNGLT